MNEVFYVYGIYHFPDKIFKYHIKRWVISSGQAIHDAQYAFVSNLYESCYKEMTKRGLVKILPDDNDNAALIETWL